MALDYIEEANRDRINHIYNSFEKAYTEGIYSDTPENRKKGRAGMIYGTTVKVGEKYNLSPFASPITIIGEREGEIVVKDAEGIERTFNTAFFNKQVKEGKAKKTEAKLPVKKKKEKVSDKKGKIKNPTNYKELEDVVFDLGGKFKITMKAGREFFVNKTVIGYNDKFTNRYERNDFYAQRSTGDRAQGSDAKPNIKTVFGERPEPVEPVKYKHIKKIEKVPSWKM